MDLYNKLGEYITNTTLCKDFEDFQDSYMLVDKFKIIYNELRDTQPTKKFILNKILNKPKLWAFYMHYYITGEVYQCHISTLDTLGFDRYLWELQRYAYSNNYKGYLEMLLEDVSFEYTEIKFKNHINQTIVDMINGVADDEDNTHNLIKFDTQPLITCRNGIVPYKYIYDEDEFRLFLLKNRNTFGDEKMLNLMNMITKVCMDHAYDANSYWQKNKKNKLDNPTINLFEEYRKMISQDFKKFIIKTVLAHILNDDKISIIITLNLLSWLNNYNIKCMRDIKNIELLYINDLLIVMYIMSDDIYYYKLFNNIFDEFKLISIED